MYLFIRLELFRSVFLIHKVLSYSNYVIEHQYGCAVYSKKDPEILPRIIGNLTMMLQDDSVQVAKKVILCMGQIYRIAFEVSLQDLMYHKVPVFKIHAVIIDGFAC